MHPVNTYFNEYADNHRFLTFNLSTLPAQRERLLLPIWAITFFLTRRSQQAYKVSMTGRSVGIKGTSLIMTCHVTRALDSVISLPTDCPALEIGPAV